MDQTTEKRRNVIVPQIAFDVLEETKKSYEKEGSIFTPDSFHTLHAVFGKILLQAGELLDNGRFVLYKVYGSNGRKVLKVGSRNELYTLFPHINFCHCSTFNLEVLSNRNASTCKHVLAARLAQICGKFKVEVVTEVQLTDLLNCQLDRGQTRNDAVDAKDYIS